MDTSSMSDPELISITLSLSYYSFIVNSWFLFGDEALAAGTLPRLKAFGTLVLEQKLTFPEKAPTVTS